MADDGLVDAVTGPDYRHPAALRVFLAPSKLKIARFLTLKLDHFSGRRPDHWLNGTKPVITSTSVNGLSRPR